MLRWSRLARCARAWTPLVVAGGLVLAWAQTAAARPETLRWSHPSPTDVQSFEAHVGTSPGSYTSIVPLGKPTPVGGVYTASIDVTDGTNVYIALRAIGTGGQQSPLSSARLRTEPPSGGPGAVYYEFDNDGLGSSVPGWLDTDAGFSLSPNDSLFQISSGNSDRVLSTGSTLDDIHSHVVPANTATQTYRLQGAMSAQDAGGGVGVTVYSDYPQSDSYYRLATTGPGGEFVVAARPGTLTCAGSGVQAVAGTWYRFRIEVVSYPDRNRIRARVWEQLTPEPTQMQIDCVDSGLQRPTGGTIGAWAAGPGTKAWDDLVFESISGPVAAPILISVDPVN